jgi:hypothetical protein
MHGQREEKFPTKPNFRTQGDPSHIYDSQVLKISGYNEKHEGRLGTLPS